VVVAVGDALGGVAPYASGSVAVPSSSAAPAALHSGAATTAVPAPAVVDVFDGSGQSGAAAAELKSHRPW
jgi:hypothetical protein